RRNHRDLHSFPTRRSSDLNCRKLPATRQLPRVRTTLVAFRVCCIWSRAGPPTSSLDSRPISQETIQTGRDSLSKIAMSPHCENKDRKSTRLNSSHVKISYA